MKIIHARKRAHLKLRGAESRGFVSSTHFAPLAFSPNNTKCVEKASGKKTLSSTQPHCRKLFLTQQKRKGKRVKQCKQFISFYLNSFSKGGVWACHNYSFLSSISLLLWIGFCKPAGPWHPPQPCLTESHSDVKLRKSPYTVCAIFTTKVIAILTMALQLKQWAVGILCTEVPASALTTSKFSFLISGGHKTWRNKVKLVLSPFSQPTVHLWWGQHHGRTKDHGLEKIFFLNLAIYLISHTGRIKQTHVQVPGPRGPSSQWNQQWRIYSPHPFWAPFSLLQLWLIAPA